MARLYPPQLEGALPAFYKTYSDDKKQISCVINIPFGINRAVNIKAIDKLALRLRTTSTNTYIVADRYSTNYDAETNIASFKFEYNSEDEDTDMTASLINEGQYYRVQLAFVQDDTIGYYSTVGIIKCVAKPTAYINGFSKDEINQFDNTFLGVYQQNTEFGDSTEKAYSYKFELFDNLGNLILESGEQIHNITEDTLSDMSNDTWVITQELDVGEIYKLRYTVTTLNGLKVSSVDYRVMRAIPVEPEYDIKLYAEANIDDGYIDIYLEGESSRDEDNYVFQSVDIDAEYNDTLIYYIKVEDEFIEYEPDETLDADSQYFAWASLRSAGRMYIKVKSTIIGEKACSGNFLITRACSKDNFFEWIEITRFTISSSFPSEYHFYDYTVEQGIQYKYALQQFNVHNIYSRKIPLRDKYGNLNATVTADFEDMFLSDGIRQLKVRFNPKVASFKNTIPEQKIETIGNKYPFIFRNGSVCYKEFPISGLISFQTDNAMLFLNDKELREAGILELKQYRDYSNIDAYSYMTGHDATRYKYQTLKIPVYFKDINGETKLAGYRYVTTEYNTRRLDIKYKNESKRYTHYNSDGNRALDGKVIYEDIDTILANIQKDNPESLMLRQDRNLTSENILGERYFKLKVLDWLTDGKVKLFRSGTEGNYLVRLLNVSLTPQDPLGRMLHTFTCTAYEIDELNYTNLVQFGIVNPTVSSNYESQWASIDIHQLLQNNTDTNDWIKISPEGITIDAIEIQDFAPGDQIKIVYDSGPDGIFSIGVTGNLELNNDDRAIIEVYIKPTPEVDPYNDFSRSFLYRTTNLQLTKFDAITDFKTYTKVCEQFIGPIDNLLEPFILRDNVYGVRNDDGVVLNPLNEIEAFNNVYNDLKAHHRFTYRINEKADKWTGLKIDILHVTKKNVIPIYLYTYKPNNVYENKFGITPFGIPYVNATNINQFINNRRTAIKYVDGDIVYQGEDGDYIRADGVNIEDIVTILDEQGITYSSYDLLEPYFFYEPTQTWISFKDYPSTAPLQIGYYDLARREWWDRNKIYDPTFSINVLDEFPETDEHGDFIKDNTIIGSNDISLIEVGDITLYNLGELELLRIGSGVVADVTAQIHVVDYEIEDTDPATKEWKNAYLTSKNSLDPLIDTAMLHIDELNDAEKEYTKLLTELQELETQIDLYEQGTNATEGVMSIASARLVNQKKKLWFNLEQQIEDILNILKEQKIYAEINATLQRDALTNYYYDDELAEEQDFFDPDNPKYLQVTNNLYLYENPDERESILLNNVRKTFRIISDAYLFYAPQYENKQQNAQNIIDKCDNQLRNLAIQQGNIIGGYLMDYDDSNPPPENTLIYAQYYIAKMEKQLDEALDHCIEVKSGYITRLLEIILSQLTEADNLNTHTDNYIKQTAGQLVGLLDDYISIRNNQMQSLNASQYNKQHIENQIATLTAQRDLLITIRDGAWDRDRRVDELINEFTPNSSISNEIARIRDTYINTVTDLINDKLVGTGKNLNDILNLTDDLDNNERVAAILNILTDAYNKEASNNVQSSLKDYFIPKTDSQNETKDKLLAAISEIDAAYQVKKKQLEDQKAIYEAQEHKYQEQLNEIQKTIDSINTTKDQAQQQYNEATEALAIGLATQRFQDSEVLIERIINNKEHQNNIQLAIDYMNWLESTQNNLLDQIGQIFANLETARDYAAMMLEFINAYEEEAFNLLHQYDALEVDLHQGFYGEDGIDWLYYQPENYWLSSYKDIFFLTDEELDDTWINRLTNTDEEIRLEAYQDLKENLANKLLDKDIIINLSILANTDQKYRLVQISETNGDKYYPDVYELTDTNLENPIELADNEFLLPDTITYNIYDCELRPVTMVEISENVQAYRKDPRAAGYYTNKSTISRLIPAFDKDISLVTDEEFEAAAENAAANNTPLQWLTKCPPVQIPIELHNSLFNTYTYSTTAENLAVNPNVLSITPNYYEFFNKILGTIVHDYKGDNEYASWMGLKELDSQILSELANYLTSYAMYNNLSLSNNQSVEEYNRLYGLVDEMNSQLIRYQGIAIECRTVLASYDAQKIDPDSSEYQQLLILLETAEEEIAYYTEQKQMYNSQLDKLLSENIEFREYTIYKQTLPDSKNHITSLIDEYAEEYSQYKKKVDHYIYLLFNNEPYGHYIDKSVIKNNSILSIGGNDTSMYNFGLAYAIEAYKRNRDSDEPINFTTLLKSIDDMNNLFNNNFDFVFPILHYTKASSQSVYNGENSYYYLTDDNTYEPYTYTGPDDWTNDIANERIYLRISPESYSIQKSYYIKDNDKFTPYRFIDETQWKEDRDKLDIYYTYYPSLIDFAAKKEYRLLNRLDNYDPLKSYYHLVGPNNYIEIQLDSENWQNAINNNDVYVQVGNGGLKGFLNNLLASSDYINSIKNNYLGTLNLYLSLLAQSLGDTTSLDNLKLLQSKDLIRKRELEEILKYKDADFLDLDRLVDEIYQNLTYYLISLTNAYINLVERSYEAV